MISVKKASFKKLLLLFAALFTILIVSTAPVAAAPAADAATPAADGEAAIDVADEAGADVADEAEAGAADEAEADATDEEGADVTDETAAVDVDEAAEVDADEAPAEANIAIEAISAPIDIEAISAPLVAEAAHVRIVIDGVRGEYTDVPIEINDRILLPFREILTKLGVPNDDDHIIWNEEEQSVTVINGENVIKLVIGDKTMTLNGEDKVFDIAPYFYAVNNRTYVPVRAVSELLDKLVDWDEASTTVLIRDKANYDETLALIDTLSAAEALIKVSTKSSTESIMKLTADDPELIGADDGDAMQFTMVMTQELSLDLENSICYVKQNSEMAGLSILQEIVLYDDHVFLKSDADGSEWKDITEQGGIDIGSILSQASVLEGQLTAEDPKKTAMALAIKKQADGTYSAVGTPVSVANMNSLISSFTETFVQQATDVDMSMKINDYQISETLSEDFAPLTAVAFMDIDMIMTVTTEDGTSETVYINMQMNMNIEYEQVEPDFEVEVPAEVLAML